MVGEVTTIAAGEHIHVTGSWINNKVYGLQLKASFIKTSSPNTKEGIERYLGSGLIKGIGPVYAKKLVQTFGEKVSDIIEANPEKLQEVEGIGTNRSSLITTAWSDQLCCFSTNIRSVLQGQYVYIVWF